MPNQTLRNNSANRYLFGYPVFADDPIGSHEYVVVICTTISDSQFLTPATVATNEVITLRSAYITPTSASTSVTFVGNHVVSGLSGSVNTTLAALCIIDTISNNIEAVIASSVLVKTITNATPNFTTSFTFTMIDK